MFNYRQRIVMPLIVATIVLCIAMVSMFIAMYQLVDYSEKNDVIDRQCHDIMALAKAITDAENGQRGYLLTGHTLFLDTFKHGRSAAQDVLKRFEKHLVTTPQLNDEFTQLQQLVQSRFLAMDQTIQVQLHAGAYASHLSFDKENGEVPMQRINGLLDRADHRLYALRLQYEKEIRQRMLHAALGAVLLSVVIVGILIFSYLSSTRLFKQVLENQAIAQQLSHENEHDTLTGLPNRRSLDVHLVNVHLLARHASRKFALFFLDLDGFKQVNDMYGHEFGDELLVEVAARLKQVLRQHDFIARLGGDEFVLVVEHYHHQIELIKLAQRLIQQFNRQVQIGPHYIHVGVSIGIAEYPLHGKGVKRLLAAADKAMYVSKQNGKNRYSFYS